MYRYPKASTLEELLIDGWTHGFTAEQTYAEIHENGFSGTIDEIRQYWANMDKQYETVLQQLHEELAA